MCVKFTLLIDQPCVRNEIRLCRIFHGSAGGAPPDQMDRPLNQNDKWDKKVWQICKCVCIFKMDLSLNHINGRYSQWIISIGYDINAQILCMPASLQYIASMTKNW